MVFLLNRDGHYVIAIKVLVSLLHVYNQLKSNWFCVLDFRAPGGLRHSDRGQSVWRDTPPHQWEGLLPGQHQRGQPGSAGVWNHLLRLSSQQGRHHRAQSHVLHSVSRHIDFRFWNSKGTCIQAHCLSLSILYNHLNCPIYMIYDRF